MLQLVFLWISEFRTFKDANLNFHSQFKFYFDKNTNTLTFQYIEKNAYINKYFPENQFISLIVGKNGVGKSSIFDLLFYGANSSIIGKIFAIFYDRERKLFKIWGAKFEDNKDVISLSKFCNEREIFILLPQFSKDENRDEEILSFYKKLNELSIIVIDFEFKERDAYHSNTEITNNKYLISSYQKLKEAFKSTLHRFSKITEVSDENLFSEKLFEIAINWYKNNMFVNLLSIFPKIWSIFQKDNNKQLPEWIYIKYNLPPETYYKDLIKSEDEKKNNFAELKESILKIWDFIFSNFQQLSIFQKMKLNFLIFLIEKYTKFSSLPFGIEYAKILKKYIDDLTINKIENFIKNSFQEFKQDILIKDAIFSLREEVESFEKLLEYIKDLQYKEERDSKIIVIKISDNGKLILDNISLLEEIAKLYRDLFNMGQSFIFFDFYPPLSSGHWRLFEIFSDIERALNPQFDNLKVTKNILLLLDEPENHLHPEWQRSFIYFLTEFLKSAYHDKNFHIIITTHSPFLLSDIPKDNVVFLNLENNKAKVVSLKNETLAQNIYYLLSDSFFMEIGIGEFVKNRIKEVLKWINEEGHYCQQFINHIGDYVLKRKLLDVWEELGRK